MLIKKSAIFHVTIFISVRSEVKVKVMSQISPISR